VICNRRRCRLRRRRPLRLGPRDTDRSRHAPRSRADFDRSMGGTCRCANHPTVAAPPIDP